LTTWPFFSKIMKVQYKRATEINLVRKSVLIVCALVISVMFVGTTWAVLFPYDYMGTVIEKDTQTDIIEIQVEYRWGGEGWAPDNCTLEGGAPNENAINEINIGDYVVAESLGGPGGKWITLGKMESSTEKFIIDIYGDPGPLGADPPLLGNYKIEFNNTADFSSCSGCNCQAKYTTITVTDQSGQKDTHRLDPGQSYVYRGEDYNIDITFLWGEASAYSYCNDSPCVGPQPVSNFVIHIRPSPANQTIGDRNGDGQTTIDELQACINQFLGSTDAEPYNDLNGDSQVTIDEVQKVINAFLGFLQSQI
jgi:hypothetical protein